MFGPALDWISDVLGPHFQSAAKKTDRLIFGSKELDPVTTFLRSIIALILFVFPGFFLVIFLGSLEETGFLFLFLFLIWSAGALVLVGVINKRQSDADKQSEKWGIRKNRWFKGGWFDK